MARVPAGWARWLVLGIVAGGLACGGSGAPSDLADEAADPGTSPDAIGEIPGDSPGDARPDTDDDGAVDVPATDGTDAEEGPADTCPSMEDAVGPARTEPVRGWILLSADPEAVRSAIEAAPRFGINHVELSQDLIMNIDEIVGDGADVQARVDVLNLAISLAHQNGMKAYIWSHELPTGFISVCYGPDGDLWRQRAQAWRTGLARIPDVDGVILMFGSAGTPPWLTFCDCDWCADTYGDGFDSPPQDERIRLIVEHVGAVVVKELGKELVGRVFVHEPEENAWHQDGLAHVTCLPFTSMHKDSVNDWQPYNPPDPTLPIAEGVPAFLETDAGAEYFGQSVLPFVAPGYFRFRLAQGAARGANGYASRIERGSRRALGTPNEVNLWALKRLQDDPHASLDAIWGEALQSLYGIASGSQASAVLRSVLEPTFPVRVKSHYALGIWALEKGSDLPSRPEFGEFFLRGDMRKWDADWTAVWESLDHPDRATILRLWQEGSEAVDLAGDALGLFQSNRTMLEEAGLKPADAADLEGRLVHQVQAARAWRAVDLFLWTSRARGQGLADADVPGILAYTVAELRDAADRLDAAGLGGVDVAGPGRMRSFADVAAGQVPEGTIAAPPPDPLFGPLQAIAVRSDGATLSFGTRRAADVSLEIGLEMPDFGRTIPVGTVEPGTPRTIEVDDLEPGRRYVARLRAPEGGGEAIGGETWIFTPFP